MSLVTRCPACGTTFKVVRDQLRISDGWVRCGRCSEVFDATLDLSDSSEPAPGSSPSPSSPPSESIEPSEPPAPPPPAVDPPPHDAATDAAIETWVEPDFFDDELEEQAQLDALEATPQVQAVEPPAEPPAPPTEPAEADSPDDAHEAPEAQAVREAHEAHVSRDLQPLPSTPSFPLAEAGVAEPAPSFNLGFTHESWPEAEALMLSDHGRTAVRPPVPPPLSFPPIELRLPTVDGDGRAPPPVLEETSNVQLAKALRRAHVKSAKIAKAKSRELQQQQPAADIAPLVHAASEADGLPVREAASSSPSSGPPTIPLPPPFAVDAPTFRQRFGGRRTWIALAVLAALLLLLQVLRQERDLIVARQPGLRPLLSGLCRVSGCEVSALRQINDIKIDGASFAREKVGDGFQLDFTLRNAANVPLAMPAIELSLFDTQERAVVRRVLMPTDFAAPAVLPAGAERVASLSLHLTGPEAASLPPVVGFKVEALYP